MESRPQEEMADTLEAPVQGRLPDKGYACEFITPVGGGALVLEVR